MLCPVLAAMTIALHVVSGMELSKCEANALWLEFQLPRESVLKYVNVQLPAGEKDKVSLVPPGSSPADLHPIQFEFDMFENCTTLAGLPYPSFTEVAVIVPNVRYMNGTDIVHYQPWAFTSNFFGSAALKLLGVQETCASKEDHDHTGNHLAMMQAGAHKKQTWAFSIDAVVDHATMVPSSQLEASDPVWHRIAKAERANMITYAPVIVTGAMKFACDQIQWDVGAVTEVTNGTFAMSGLDLFMPSELKNIKTRIQDVHKLYNGHAYALHTRMVAKSGCPKSAWK